MDEKTLAALKEHPDYLNLVKTRNKIIWPLAALMVFVYFFYVLVIAFAPDVFAISVGGAYTTLGIACGLGIILFAFLLTGFYIRKANTVLDPIAHKLHASLEKSEGE